MSGRVVEARSGTQVAWTMARGYPGAFGEHVPRLYIWLPHDLLRSDFATMDALLFSFVDRLA